MSHHVLHVRAETRLPVLVDLTSAPGRTIVFTRTKHRAKSLMRQLNAQGVPTVDLHGNLGQNARTRNLAAFHSGEATTLVATDIAARGIHVDDVALVVHADPPVEHKAYLHRSGRTARAGADGNVITLMTDEQVKDVRALTRAAGISATTTKIHDIAHPLLLELAPGVRALVKGGHVPAGGVQQDSDGRGQGRQSNGGGKSGGRSRGRSGTSAITLRWREQGCQVDLRCRSRQRKVTLAWSRRCTRSSGCLVQQPQRRLVQQQPPRPLTSRTHLPSAALGLSRSGEARWGYGRT